MVKYIGITFFWLTSIFGLAQDKPIQVKLSGNLFNLPSDTFYISQNKGGIISMIYLREQ